MTVFHENLRRAETKLKRTRLFDKILRIFTLGTRNLEPKRKLCEEEYYQRHQDLEEYLLTTKEYQDLNLYLQFCNTQGTSVTAVGPESEITAGKEDYGPDWEDLSRSVRKRDGYVCQETDGKCRGPLQVHHIISLSRGGTNQEDNLITLCEYHHSLKHSHMLGRSS